MIHARGKGKPWTRRLHAASHFFSHHLPLSLLLAAVFCTVNVLKPGFMKTTDSAWMSMTIQSINALVPQWQGRLVETRMTMADTPSITVVSLVPTAWTRYFQSVTPTPRFRLACVIQALAERLDEINARSFVVGIDIDITPIDRPPRLLDDKGETGCRGRLPGDAKQAMVAALEHLSRHRCVVAIAFPRNPDDARSRDDFMRELPTLVKEHRERLPKNLHVDAKQTPCIAFASPSIHHAVNDAVKDYPTTLRTATRETHGAHEAHDARDQFCSFGRALGAALYESLPRQDTSDGAPACGQRQRLSHDPLGVRFDAKSEFDMQPIEIVPALVALTTTDITAVAQDTKPFDLYDDARAGFGNVAPADVYILTADNGGTADTFAVPGFGSFVAGAWVHGAVALTEYRVLRRPLQEHGGVVGYLRHLVYDLALALVAAAILDVLMNRGSRLRDEVLRDMVVMTLPLLVLGSVLLFHFVLTAEDLANGDWNSPAPVVLGMVLHAYLHLVKEAAPAFEPDLGRRAGVWARLHRLDLVRWTGQTAWAGLIIGSFVLGIRPDIDEFVGVVAGLSALAGLGYVFVARAVAWAPLPWRSPHVES